VIPVLKDAGQVGTPFGQLVVAGASIVEIATRFSAPSFAGRSSSSLIATSR